MDSGFTRRPPIGSDAYRAWQDGHGRATEPDTEHFPPAKAPVIEHRAGVGGSAGMAGGGGGGRLFGGRPAPAPPGPSSFGGGRVFEQHGGAGAMARLAAVNFVLNLVTLSLYRFWGKTRVRRFLWGNTTAWGEPVEYTGTGKELFIGFVVVMVTVFLPLMLAFGAVQAMAVAFPPAGLLMLPLQMFVLVLAGAGLYRARRYQMSRTVWRGIRGGQEGSALSYGLTFLWVMVASFLSAGWAWPWGDMKLARHRLGHTSFGDRGFECDAVAAPLYKRFAVVWVAWLVFGMAAGAWMAGVMPDPEMASPAQVVAAMLVGYLGMAVIGLVVVALPYAWYKAAFYRELAANTRFGDLSFSAEVETWPLIRLMVGNWALTLFSLGILRPLAALRTFRYACSAIQVEGRLDAARLAQSRSERPGTGEGLVAVLDGAGDF